MLNNHEESSICCMASKYIIETNIPKNENQKDGLNMTTKDTENKVEAVSSDNASWRHEPCSLDRTDSSNIFSCNNRARPFSQYVKGNRWKPKYNILFQQCQRVNFADHHSEEPEIIINGIRYKGCCSMEKHC